jgi:ABC-type branched-subunit amino acid transport system permease subunit
LKPPLWNVLGLVAVGTAGLLTLILVPLLAPLHVQLQLTLYFSFAILALSLAFIWGYGGIFSFGQATFFGLGGYTYAIMAINMNESTLAIGAALLLPAVFAAVLGYFMFYGRLSSVYLAVITLVVTLLFHTFLGHTAGFEYRIGDAALGGYNGIPAIPPLNLPGDTSRFIGPEQMFYVSGLCLLATYFGLRLLLGTHFGRIVVGIRENELRVELLGYDVRLYKTAAFTIAAVVAALGGVMFTNWNSFIDPHVFNLGTSAEIIIWVIVGGLGTLVGPILGAIALGFLAVELGTQQRFDVNLILGAILVVFVLVVPQGIVPTMRRLLTDGWESRSFRRASP